MYVNTAAPAPAPAPVPTRGSMQIERKPERVTRLRIAGLQAYAYVEPMNTIMMGETPVWTVRIFDHAANGITATATVTGTRLKATQQAAGLLVGYALANGVEQATVPTLIELRAALEA